MDSQDKRQKQVKRARISFIILLTGLSVALLANVVRLFDDGVDYALVAFIAILIVLGLIVSYFVITAQGRAKGKLFKAFQSKYPVSYMCQPELVMSSQIYALARDDNDLVVFDITKKEFKELLRMVVKDINITPTKVSQNGMRKFIGLHIKSNTDEARFVLLNDKSPLLLANNNHQYAEDAASNLLS